MTTIHIIKHAIQVHAQNGSIKIEKNTKKYNQDQEKPMDFLNYQIKNIYNLQNFFFFFKNHQNFIIQYPFLYCQMFLLGLSAHFFLFICPTCHIFGNHLIIFYILM